VSICSNLFGNLRRAGGGDERERERERNTVRNLKTIFDYMNRLSRTETGRII